MLRSEGMAALDSLEVHSAQGDGTAVAINSFHNKDPSSMSPSACFIDGDSQQKESDADRVFRLPGQMPESHVFTEVMERLDECAGKLAVALHCKYEDESRVRHVLQEVQYSNRDPHTLFSQIGEKLGLLSESVVRGAFISMWCYLRSTVVRQTLTSIDALIPRDSN